ncbi:MAG TPA: GNAT family N-acetyltransferase [Ramlibacter sp.]|nr:GNAT family N-acetyltransferase [Ramlibacter sp.]
MAGIQDLGVNDLEGAQALVAESGWNQVRADWELFTHLGSAFKVEGPAGRVAATAATLPFTTGFGWISMVLVAKSQRRQGIATALLQHCIDRLQAAGLVPVLDATPAGREVYKLLGFRDGWAITRWRATERAGVSGSARDSSITIRSIADTDWPRIVELDSKAFGADRGRLLQGLGARSRGFSCIAEQEGRLAGFLLGRDGRLATQVGPIVARDESVAQRLLGHALARIEGPVLVDVLDRHAAFSQRLPAAGFAIERGYTRMTLGRETCFGDDELTVAIAGPELG